MQRFLFCGLCKIFARILWVECWALWAYLINYHFSVCLFSSIKSLVRITAWMVCSSENLKIIMINNTFSTVSYKSKKTTSHRIWETKRATDPLRDSFRGISLMAVIVRRGKSNCRLVAICSYCSFYRLLFFFGILGVLRILIAGPWMFWVQERLKDRRGQK